MFKHCTGLKDLTLNNNIGEQAFLGCTGLESFTSNSAIIADYAFTGCTKLSQVVLTNENLEVGTFVFNGCSSLETFGPITEDGSCVYDFNFAWRTKIPNYAFRQDWDNRKIVKEVTLPSTLREIGTLAFNNAVSLTKIQLPESLEVIGEQAFEYCSGLSKLVIPAKVTDIKNLAFANCKGLTTVNIKARSSSTKIEDPANSWFKDTNAEMTVYIPADIFTSMESVADQYGTHWNAVSQKDDESWVYIETIVGYTEPDEN
jgi:hypothetical protein